MATTESEMIWTEQASESANGRRTAVRPSARARTGAGAWASFNLACEARRSYRVELCDQLLNPASKVLREAVGGRASLLVTTPTVERLYGRALREVMRPGNAPTLVLVANEETKSMELVQSVCEAAFSQGLDRRGLLIGLGGGVCLDIVTLSASLIRRGVAHLRVPTTLIGQIDAGIGLKGAVNFRGKKSFIGCFHPPERVLIDPAFLGSLPARVLSSGIAEAIKMAVALDPQLFKVLESTIARLLASRFAEPRPEGREILKRSIGQMLEELQANPYEDQGHERVVDFGHTFSPILEAALEFKITHGEAVAIDMALSAALSMNLGLLKRDTFIRILALLRAASLPMMSRRMTVDLCCEALAEASRHRRGRVNLVVPTAIGQTAFLRDAREIPRSAIVNSLALLEKSCD